MLKTKYKVMTESYVIDYEYIDFDLAAHLLFKTEHLCTISIRVSRINCVVISCNATIVCDRDVMRQAVCLVLLP